MVGKTEEKLLVDVEQRKDELITLCRELVKINTVNPYSGDPNPGTEKEGQLFLKPILEEMRASTKLIDTPPDIYDRTGVLGPKNRCFRDRPSLIAELDFGGEGKRIIVNGHMDTVGVSDMTIEPFAAEVREGKIFGRGTSDCKGGIAVAVVVLKVLLKYADDLSGTVVFESVTDEECSGSGAGTLTCCLRGYRGDGAIVIDGNDLVITRGCGGCLTADLTVWGRTGHAARGGVSAIDRAMIIKGAIDTFKKERETQFPGPLVNLGVFNAGIHPAMVPGRAFLSLNIVYQLQEAARAEGAGKGWNGSVVREQFEEIIRVANCSDDFLREHPTQIEWVKDLIPFELDEHAPLITAVGDAFSDVMGRAPEVRTMSAWTDAAYHPHFAATPAVLFGPGTSTACHAPDESVEISNLVNCAKVLAVYLYRSLKN